MNALLFPIPYSQMARLKKFPKISSLLMIATYGVFGWIYGALVGELITQEQLWHKWFIPSVAIGISYGVGLLSIITIVLFFTAPITLLTLGMNHWFKLDSRALLAITLSLAAFILIIEHPVILSRFLILSAAATLFRFDLQLAGYSNKITQVILTLFSAIAFTIGIVINRVVISI
jgi:hypothetical protein